MFGFGIYVGRCVNESDAQILFLPVKICLMVSTQSQILSLGFSECPPELQELSSNFAIEVAHQDNSNLLLEEE